MQAAAAGHRECTCTNTTRRAAGTCWAAAGRPLSRTCVKQVKHQHVCARCRQVVAAPQPGRVALDNHYLVAEAIGGCVAARHRAQQRVHLGGDHAVGACGGSLQGQGAAARPQVHDGDALACGSSSQAPPHAAAVTYAANHVRSGKLG